MEILDGSRNLTQQLTYELGQAIVRGKYQIDDTFPTEAELSSQFNISRSVTREAVKMLTAKGLIRSRPRKGIRVQPSNLWNMFDNDVLNWTLSAQASIPLLLEVIQLRVAIEPEAAALTCANATAEQQQQFRDFYVKTQRKLSELEAIELTTAVGIAVLEASQNRFYSQFCDFIGASKRMSLECIDPRTIQVTEQCDLLQQVCHAILQKNSDFARQSMRELLLAWVKEIKNLSLASVNQVKINSFEMV